MNYQQVLDYLYRSLPMFQRMGATAFKKDLSNTLALCKGLGHPERKIKSIHVAGTNGKGSSSHMLASVLQESGFKVGLYTSPHLKSFTERIKINGKKVSEDFVTDFVNANQELLESVKPSFFETTVAMAFQCFAEEQVDIAVIEVGLGGRLDSTNVIIPEVSLITNIGFDHMDFLGNTLPEIASEKAGIIKQGVPVVISEKHPETFLVFERIAKEKNSSLVFAEDFVNEAIPNTDLKGKYQDKNLRGVLVTIDVLNKNGWTIPAKAIKEGLANVQRNTGLKGRWQILKDEPLTICDTGHNKEAFEYLMEQVTSLKHNKLYMVLGFMKDKDIAPLLDMLPKHAELTFCIPKVPRALQLEDLKVRTKSIPQTKSYTPDVNEAIESVQLMAQTGDVIFIGGSTFVVAEIQNI